MAIEIRMPELSDLDEADLLAWLVKPGDRVAAGDLIAEIETDKSTVEFESPATGTILELVVAEGTNGVAVGTVLALLDAGDEQPAAAPRPEAVSPAAETESAPAAEAPASRAPKPRADTLDATALAKRLATRAGLDLASLQGTGPGGRIVKSDVEAALSSRVAAAPVAETSAAAVASQGGPGRAATAAPASVELPFRAEPHSRMRRTIASRLGQAKREVPHFYLSVECDLDRLLDVRQRLNGDGARISVNDFVVRAAALALVEVPRANVSFTDEALHVYERADVSVAVATDAGLVTPVVRDAARKALSVISEEIRDLAGRAREGKLAPAEYQGGTFTVSNLGMYGIDSVYPILNPPQSCILGVGQGSQRAVARDGVLAVATVMTCTLSADHRAIDGAIGAGLLAAFKRRIEDPLEMLL